MWESRFLKGQEKEDFLLLLYCVFFQPLRHKEVLHPALCGDTLCLTLRCDCMGVNLLMRFLHRVYSTSIVSGVEWSRARGTSRSQTVP